MHNAYQHARVRRIAEVPEGCASTSLRLFEQALR